MPQNQSTTLTASDESVSTFLSLSDDQKKTALGNLSPGAKTALLEGIKRKQSGAPAIPPPPKPDSTLGGFARRAGDTLGGFASTFAPPDPQSSDPWEREIAAEGGRGANAGMPIYRIGKGLYDVEKKAAGQVASQVKEGNYGRAAVTGASMLDPFATGSVTDINEMRDEGRSREALGAGAFDIATLLLGGGFKAIKESAFPESAERARVAKLTAAGGETPEVARGVKATIRDLSETSRLRGAPAETVGDFLDVVNRTKGMYDQAFNQGLAPITNNQVMPQEVSSRIRRLQTPNMAKTAEGRDAIRQINKAAREFERPWSLSELNSERMSRGADTHKLYAKGPGAANAALKSDLDLAIDKAVNEGAKEIVYREIGRANPNINAQELKQKQSLLIDLQGELQDRVDTLEAKQLGREAKGPLERVRTHGYMGQSGFHGYVGRLSEALPGSGPMDYANAKVKSAFLPRGVTRTQAGVLSLPIQRLTEKPKKSAKIAPPPGYDDE